MSLLVALLDLRAQEAFTAPAVAAAKRSLSPAERETYTRTVRSEARSKSGAGWDEQKHKRAAKGATGGGRFVSSGSSGEAVRTVQQRVGAKGDGKFGGRTKRAVMDFQRRHGLKVDGVVGRQTALALAGHFTEAKRTRPGPLDARSKKLLRAASKGGRSLRARTRRARGGVLI